MNILNIKNKKLLTLSEQIVEQIKESIVEGHLKKGDKLPSEQDLAVLYQVSRPTVRDAIKILSASKLIYTKPGAKGGHFITDISAQSFIDDFSNYINISLVLEGFSINELIEYRRLFEVTTCVLAAKRRTEDDLIELKKLIPTPEDNLTNQEYFERDFDFHRTLAKSTHNLLFIITMEAITNVLKPMFQFVHGTPELREKLTNELLNIYKAVEKGDYELAEEEINRHLNRFERDFSIDGLPLENRKKITL
ncbi:FadR/GntR family transcriptional regulator [Bacillus sp. EB106-08-02-XG196]|uniref:FadR/GntR family transcriptional regulator n=1 Tax=Bacillus sp. EB106-08-02-XG196 TaxID=2737049 RepID=UPI0034D2D33E